jgi:hypothetical protein
MKHRARQPTHPQAAAAMNSWSICADSFIRFSTQAVTTRVKPPWPLRRSGTHGEITKAEFEQLKKDLTG